jgi:hypothetical protein
LEKKFPRVGKIEDKKAMKAIAIFLTLAALLSLAGCANPTYEDGTPREYSDMPWNTPASWEGSVGIPGMSGYD